MDIQQFFRDSHCEIILNTTNVIEVSNAYEAFNIVRCNDLNIDCFDLSRPGLNASRYVRAASSTHTLQGVNVDFYTPSATMIDSDWFMYEALSQSSYDAGLIYWNAQPSIESGVSIDVSNTNYSVGAAADARQNLIDTYGWIFTDAGVA